VAGTVQVLGVEQGHEARIGVEVGPGEAHQPLDRGQRLQLLQPELALGGADVGIGALQGGEIERFLVAYIIVEQALVGPGGAGDAIDPRTHVAMIGELHARRRQDAELGCAGVADGELGTGAFHTRSPPSPSYGGG
jgi:hypothetical protein